MIKYLGSKRTLIPAILEVVEAIKPDGRVIDMFSGTSRVGHALKKAGYQVYSNDHNAYAHALATCYVQADAEDHLKAVEQLVKEFNQMPGREGYFTDSFCIKSRFFQPKNGARIDAIRTAIEEKQLHPELKAILIVSLMEAADRVDSTTGVQMAYLKQWAPRASNDLELRVPAIVKRGRSGKSQAFLMDALQATDQLEADIGYFDPPYNQHKYLGNYHIWETLTLWDKPEIYGVACKRVDCTERSSKFNAKKEARDAMKYVIEKSRAQHLVVSFNNEGYLSKQDFEEMLAARGDVVVLEHDFKRYVGAQIGIHNPSGEKVGEVSHLRNTEYLYVASKDKSVIDRVQKIKERLLKGQVATLLPQTGKKVPVASQPGSVTEASKRVVELLEKQGSIAPAEAHAALSIDVATLKVVFRDLVARKTVSMVGHGRGTRYAIASQETLDTPDVSQVEVAQKPSLPADSTLHAALAELLQKRRELSSAEAQAELNVSADLLRPIFKDLIARGQLLTVGQRRGMRYRWQTPIISAAPAMPAPSPAMTLPVRPVAQMALFSQSSQA